ncbi:MAG: YiiX/YebB-like N1pC/P60 family cysteine hydrolase [Hyphomicrobiaceae bacterium]
MARASSCRAFDGDFYQLAMLCRQEVSSAAELEDQLQKIYTHVFNVDLARYDLRRLRDAAPELLDDFYDLRIGLRGRIADWQSKDQITAKSEKLLRDVFRALRYATDMIGELMTGFRQRKPGRSRRLAFSKRTRGTLFHPAMRGVRFAEFKSGDVIVVRGTIHNSAAIARISDVDSQFSHAALVYVDPKGRQHVVEALIEAGATINNLHGALSHDLGRAVVFRHTDEELAKRAAEQIYDHVRSSRRLFGRRIPYDFSMELEGYDKLFCSKLIRQAFDEASDGMHKLPTFASRFEKGARDFLDRIGVTARVSFAPADLELEPSFDAIAEWRDFERTSAIRLQDFVMVKLFEWMEEMDYTFKEPPALHIISRLGRASAYIPWPLSSLLALVAPAVPMNMKRSTISAIAMLHYTAEPLFKQLQTLERKSVFERGYPLHPREILAHLENVREQSPERIGYLWAPERTEDAEGATVAAGAQRAGI